MNPYDDDDDLPVLTQVLRTGSGAMPPVVLLPDLDVRLADDTLHAPPLVIGNEPHQRIETYLMPSTPTAESLDGDVAAQDGAIEPDAVDPPDAPQLLPFHEAEEARRAEGAEGAEGAEAEGIATVAPAESIAEPAVALESFTGDDTPEPTVHPPPPAPVIDLDALHAQVRAAVLDDLVARVDVELEARIAQAIHAEIETALAKLQADLRGHLTDAMRDLVGRAVAEQIVRIAPGAADPPH